ncbi:MAG: peptidylprolyl isomerase [Pseudomonadota bacterium]
MRRLKFNTVIMCGLLAGMTFGASAADDTVLLQRGEVRITESDLRHLINSLVPLTDQAGFMADPARVRQILVDNYVVEALSTEAKEAGLDKNPEIIFRQQYQAKKELAQLYLTTLLNKDQPNWDQLARENYAANKDQFKVPERVHVVHILVAINDKRTDAEAAKRADEAYKKALAGKVPFAELVAEYSDDSSAKQNQGDLGFFGKGQMVPPFEEAAFAMTKPGSISKPVKSQFGYHILQYKAREAARTLAYDEVKDQVLKQEREKFANTTRDAKLAAVRSDSAIEVNMPAIEDLIKRLNEEAKARIVVK